MIKPFLAGLALAGISLGVATAQDYTLSIRGQVPVVCRAALSSDASGFHLNQFCNAAGGFEVWVDYPPALAGGILTIDGRNFVLTDAGQVRIAQFSQAGARSDAVALAAPAGQDPAQLSFRAAPL